MSERIRVLRIIARLNVGGPAVQITSLAQGLDPETYEQRILTGTVDPDEADHLALRAPDLPVTRVPWLGRRVSAIQDLRALRSLVDEIRQFRPDIVHTHTAKAGVLGRLAALQCGVPATVHTFHGHLLHGYYSPPVTKAITLVEAALARRTTRLVAVGERVRDDLLAAGIGRPDQFVVVPPGLALPDRPPRADARAVLGLPADGLVVAFVARLTGIKRPDRFLDVADMCRDTGAIFLVVGEGPLLSEIRAEAARRDLSNVRFAGWRGDVETVYAASDLVLLTSDNEGTPVALIEAALAGVPAVATDVGSVREVVVHQETGLVTAAEPRQLAEATIGLLRDGPTRLQMGRAASERAEQRFGASRLVADTDRLYRSLVRR